MTPNQNSSERPRRDALAERVLLDHSQRLARISVCSWPQQVEDRLEAGQALYGDSALSRPLTDLLDEIAEEALDIGGWSCLASQVLISSPLDAATTATVSDMLALAIAAGAAAHAHVVAAQAAIRRAAR